MNEGEFGRLLAALRREHMAEGNPLNCWTQERLGRESGLGMRIISDIETGKKQKLDREIILRLAEALRLTSRERKEFIYAAAGIEGKASVRAVQDLQAVLTRQIEIMREIRVPAFLMDVYGDIVAANGAIAELFGVTPVMINSAKSQLAGFNLMRVIFDTQEMHFRAVVGNDWPRYARHNIHHFRALSLRYRHKPEFQAIFGALASFPDFMAYWTGAADEPEDYYSTSLHYHYQHPRCGLLSYYTASAITLTGGGELSLTVYLPASTETANTFARLVKERDLVLRLAPWPKGSN